MVALPFRLKDMLKMLQELTMKLIGRAQVLFEKPRAIGRDVVHRIELVAEKRRPGERNAFLREFGADHVNASKRGSKPAQHRQVS